MDFAGFPASLPIEDDMIERTLMAGTTRFCLMIGVLFVAVAGTPGLAVAADIIVDTIRDIDGDNMDGERSFRWAITEANRSADSDTIFFQFLDPNDYDTIVDPDDPNFLRLVLDNTPANTFRITSELIIRGPTIADGAAQDYFIIIDRENPSISDIFLTEQKLTLINADLAGEGLIFNGPGSTGTSTDFIDVVYDIGDFVHDVTGRSKDSFLNEPRIGPGRVVKDGVGELAYLTKDPADPLIDDYGGTLLVDGVIRTDSFSLVGDIQLCADESDTEYDSGNCAGALLVFEMPSVAKDTDLVRPDAPTDGTYAGNITDGVRMTAPTALARVLKTGAGDLTLAGDNNYGGGTYVYEGRLLGDTDAIQGDVRICPGVLPTDTPNGNDSSQFSCPAMSTATVVLDLDTAGTFDGAFYGEGIVEKDGNGTLTIENTDTQATFNGTFNVNDGTLDLQTFLGGDGSVNVVDVNVNGGTLTGTTDGVISGAVTVSSSGRILGDIDLVGDLQLAGTLELVPGTTMTGTTATIADGSTIEVIASDTPATGMLDLAGLVILERATVDVEFASTVVDAFIAGPVGATQSFALIDSDVLVGTTLTGGAAGDGIEFESAIFELELTYNDSASCTLVGMGNVCLTATFDPMIEDDAETENQSEIARAIDQAFVCAQTPTLPECQIDQDTADDFNVVFANFAIAAADIPDVLDQIAGEEYTALVDVRSAASTRYNRSISRRFDLEFPMTKPGEKQTSAVPAVSASGSAVTALLRSASTPSGFAGFAVAASAAPKRGGYRDYRRNRLAWRRSKRKEPMSMGRHVGQGGITSWLDIHGVMGELGGSKNAEDVDYRIYGPLYGMDYAITDHVTVGATVGYSRTEMKTPHSVSKTTGNTYQGGAYVGVMYDSFHVTGSTRFAHSDLKSRRSVRFNDIDRTASSDTDANDVSAFFEAAYHVPMRQNVLLQPMLSVTYDHMDQDSFSERGLDSLDLDIDGDEVDTLQTSFGLRLALFGRDDDGRYILPQLRLAYEREWFDPNRAITGNLTSAGSNGQFKVNGLSLPQDRGVIGLSSEVGVSDNLNMFADYDLRAAKDLLEHSLSFGFRAIW